MFWYLALNSSKTKELEVDFRRRWEEPASLYIKSTEVERVSNFKFLDALVKKAQQQLIFWGHWRKLDCLTPLLWSFIRCSVECMLPYGILVWLVSCTKAERKVLQNVINTAQDIISTHLSLDDIYRSRCLQHAKNIIKDSSHPSKHLFTLLPSGRSYMALWTCTSRFLNSFYPCVIT